MDFKCSLIWKIVPRNWMHTIYLEHCKPSDVVKIDKTWKLLFLSVFVEGDGISLGKPYVLDWNRISAIKVKNISTIFHDLTSANHFFNQFCFVVKYWSIKDSLFSYKSKKKYALSEHTSPMNILKNWGRMVIILSYQLYLKDSISFWKNFCIQNAVGFQRSAYIYIPNHCHFHHMLPQ